MTPGDWIIVVLVVLGVLVLVEQARRPGEQARGAGRLIALGLVAVVGYLVVAGQPRPSAVPASPADGTPPPTAAPQPAPARPAASPWSRSGVGDNVFDVDEGEQRIRISAAYGGHSQNFVVWIGGSLVVNEVLGTGADLGTRYQGVVLARGGVVEVRGSGVRWSMERTR